MYKTLKQEEKEEILLLFLQELILEVLSPLCLITFLIPRLKFQPKRDRKEVVLNVTFS